MEQLELQRLVRVLVLIERRLLVQRRREHVRVEEQLQERVQQPAEEPYDRFVRVEQRRVFELVEEPWRQARACAELLEQIRAHPGRVQEPFELRGGKLPDLLLG